MNDSPTSGLQHKRGEGNSRKRWLRAAGLSTLVCAIWVVYLNWDGCWLYALGIRALYIMFFPWLCLLLFIGTRLRGRLILIGLTLFVWWFWAGLERNPAAANESTAVGRLRQLKSSLEEARTTTPKHGYPERTPRIQSDYPIQKFYRFVYIPERAADGSVGSYVIQATPIRPECGCGIRSFTLAEDGQIHYTVERRPATVRDSPLE